MSSSLDLSSEMVEELIRRTSLVFLDDLSTANFN